MFGLPDGRRALWRRGLLGFAVAAAPAAFCALAGLPDCGAFGRGSALNSATPSALTGRHRTFLTAEESEEAARRGLAPRGIRSVLATHGPLAFGGWRWDAAGVPPGPLAIRVDLDRQLVSVFRGTDEIGTAVIVYGARGKETPRGKLPILGKARDYHSVTYDAAMPFSLWLSRDGVAIHGSPVTADHATNGCIGVPVEFAEKLFEAATKGDIVEVIGSAAAG